MYSLAQIQYKEIQNYHLFSTSNTEKNTNQGQFVELFLKLAESRQIRSMNKQI